MKKLAILAITLLLGSGLEAKKAAPALNIIPEPQSVSFGKGEFKVKGANFNYDSFLGKNTAEAIAKLADDIYISTGKVSSLAVATGVNYGSPIGSLKGIYFLKDATLAPEEYKIEVASRAVKVTAADHNGFLYAIATLRQMHNARLRPPFLPGGRGEEVAGRVRDVQDQPLPLASHRRPGLAPGDKEVSPPHRGGILPRRHPDYHRPQQT